MRHLFIASLMALSTGLCSRSSAAAQSVTEKNVGAYRVSITVARLNAQRDGLGRDAHGSATLRRRRILGTDGGVPDTVIRNITLAHEGRTYRLPAELYSDLGDPQVGPPFSTRSFSLHESRSYLFITLAGGDGAGSYSCRWCISKAQLVTSRSIRPFSSYLTGEFAPFGSALPLTAPR